MNKSYLTNTVLTCALALLGLTPFNRANADELIDPGIPDTVRVVSVQVNAGDHFPLVIYLWNDETLAAATLGFGWGTSDLFLDSISYVGTRTASTDFPSVKINNNAHLGLTGFATFFGDPLPAGEGEFAILWFTADANAADQEIRIDSSFVPPAGPFILVNQSDVSQIKPQFVMGAVTIANPNSNTPPAFDPLFSQTIDVGDTLLVTVNAVDPDGDSLILELLNPPASNSSFTDNGDGSGLFVFAPSVSQSDSTYLFIFRASDQDTSVTEDFEVIVNPIVISVDSAFVSPDTLFFSAPEGADVILSDCAWLSSTNAPAEFSGTIIADFPSPFFISSAVTVGQTNDSVCVTVNPSGLSVGKYYSSVIYEVTGVSNNLIELVVCLNVGTPQSTAIQLDIKPGSCPNPLNTKGRNAQHKAVLPVAIVGTNNFDVRDIDVSSLALEGVSPVRWSYEDVSEPIERFSECDCQETTPDGIEDLTLKFYRSDLIDALGGLVGIDEVSLTITGRLNDGTDFSASDCIETKPNDKGGADGPPGAITLVGNYPNPFNPTTKITFGLPESERVTISVYNVKGQKIATLVDDVMEAGYHDVEWDASNLASGMYFYRLQATSFSQTRKMILLK